MKNLEVDEQIAEQIQSALMELCGDVFAVGQSGSYVSFRHVKYDVLLYVYRDPEAGIIVRLKARGQRIRTWRARRNGSIGVGAIVYATRNAITKREAAFCRVQNEKIAYARSNALITDVGDEVRQHPFVSHVLPCARPDLTPRVSLRINVTVRDAEQWAHIQAALDCLEPMRGVGNGSG